MDLRYTRVIQITVLYVSGIIFQLILSIPLSFIIISSILFLLFLILKKKYSLILLLCFFFGLGYTNLAENNFYSKDIHSLPSKKYLISGRVTSYPIRSEKFQKFLFSIDRIGNKDKTGTIQVFIRPYIKIEKHSRLALYGKINFPGGPANFGEFDYSRFYKGLNIDGTLFIYNYKQIQKNIPPDKHSLQFMISGIRNDIKKYIRQHYYPVQNSFLSAVLIGEKVNIPIQIKDIFIRSGAYHLLAISGLHVGLITLIFLTIFINLRIPKKTSLLLILVFIVLYNLIIGYKAPILRASFMFFSMILCYLFDRDRNFLNSLCLAALAILLLNPLALMTVSFQLSFLATAGIIIFTPVLKEIIKKIITTDNKFLHFFINIFIISFSAQILILPVLMFNFKQFAYVSFFANLAAIPFTTVILFLSLFAYFFFHLIPLFTACLANVSNLIIAIMIHILNFFSLLAPLLRCESFNSSLLIIYLSIVFLLSKKLFIKKEIPFLDNKKTKYGLCLILIILFVCGFALQKKISLSQKNELAVVFFNIKGKSVLIKTPSNTIMIDTGYEDDMKKCILPFLKKYNIDRIDYLILSNITRSRSQGAPYLLKHMPVTHYMDTDPSAGFRYERIMEIVNQKKIKYRAITSGHFIIDKVKFHVLNPSSASYKDPKNNSLVLNMEYENKNILFCSDIKKEAVHYFTSAYNKNIRPDIINMPDLNRDNKSINSLFKLHRPAYAVINKRFTYFENKDIKWTIDKLEKNNIKYYFTKEDGAVKICLSKNNIKIITSYNRK